MSAKKYIEAVKKLIEHIENTQMDTIHQVAILVTQAITNERLVYIFGAGHSSLLSIECFSRAGGLANMQAMIDAGLDYGSGARRQSGFERLSGYAKCMVHDYDIQEGDLVIIISNSGRNSTSVEMALEVKKLGATVVTLTSIAHSSEVTSNDPSGKKVMEIADLVLDNGCPPGDALVELPGLLPRVGPGSTVAGAVILNAIVTQTAANLLEKGLNPPMGFSGNLPQAKEYNMKLREEREVFRRKMVHR